VLQLLSYVTTVAEVSLFWCSAFDLEDKVVGTVGAGRIGQRVLQRLAVSHHANPCKACDCTDTFCLAGGTLTVHCCRLTVAIFKLVKCQSLLSVWSMWCMLCTCLTLHRFTSRLCELSLHVLQGFSSFGVPAQSLVIDNICACVQGFDCKELLYTDYKQLPAALEKSLNCRYVKDVADLVKECDIVTINAPLHKVGLL